MNTTKIRVWPRLLTLALLLSAVQPSRAADDPAPETMAIRKIIEANYARLAASLQAADTDAIVAQTTDDFTSTDETGKTVDRDAYEEDLKGIIEQLKNFQVTGVTNAIEEFKTGPERATVMILQTWTASIKGPDATVHPLTFQMLYRDIWVPNDDKTNWLQRHSEAQDRPTATMDGKPIDVPENPAPDA